MGPHRRPMIGTARLTTLAHVIGIPVRQISHRFFIGADQQVQVLLPVSTVAGTGILMKPVDHPVKIPICLVGVIDGGIRRQIQQLQARFQSHIFLSFKKQHRSTTWVGPSFERQGVSDTGTTSSVPQEWIVPGERKTGFLT